MENRQAKTSVGSIEVEQGQDATVIDNNKYLLSAMMPLETPATSLKLQVTVGQCKVTWDSASQTYVQTLTEVDGGTKTIRWYYSSDGVNNFMYLGNTTATCTVTNNTDELDALSSPVMPNATHFRIQLVGSGTKFYYDYADIPKSQTGTNTYL